MLLCVSLVWPTKFANILSFYAKQIWRLRIYGERLMILILGKLGLKQVFWNTFHHILMHFVHQFQCLEMFLKCVFVIFKNCIFSQKFCEPLSALINPVCFLINRNCFKIFWRSLYLFRLIETDFWSIENRELGFFRIRVWLVQTHFSKSFSNFSQSFSNFSLSPNWTRLTNKFFLSFSSEIFARFSSL